MALRNEAKKEILEEPEAKAHSGEELAHNGMKGVEAVKSWNLLESENREEIPARSQKLLQSAST